MRTTSQPRETLGGPSRRTDRRVDVAHPRRTHRSRASGTGGRSRGHHRRSGPVVQARRRLRRHRDRRLRQRPERHGQRYRRLVGIRSGARLQRVRHLHQGAGRRHEGHGLDHRLHGRTDRLRPEHALLPLRLRQHQRGQRQRLPVHHRELLPHLRRDGQLVDRADHQAVRLPQPDSRGVEAHHLRPDRLHGRALRGRRRGRPQHLGHHHARRHRLRHHQGQLHRQVRLRR